jgi:hypothetical protein
MMYRCYIVWLDVHSRNVVFLRQLQLIQLVIAKGSVVKGFEMSWINLNSFRIVLNRSLIVFELSIGKASVMVEI